MTGQTPMPTFKRWKKDTVLCLLLAFCLGGLACCKGKEAGETAKLSDTQTEWPKKTYDFGDMAEGEVVSHSFYFKNTGKGNFVIRKVESGCGCTTAKYDPQPVKAGKEGKFEIEFNSKGRFGKQYKEIRIFANVPEKEIVLKFTANVK